MRLATTEAWKDKQSGERREITEWHRVVFYRRLAEIVSQYLKKGSQIYLEGRIRTRKWQDKDGADRSTTEIEAQELQMLGRKQEGTGNAPAQGQAPQGAAKPAPASGGGGGNFEDDIPFDRPGRGSACHVI